MKVNVYETAVKETPALRAIELEPQIHVFSECGGTIAVGDWVVPDGVNRLITATEPTAGGYVVVFGKALESGIIGQIKKFTYLPHVWHGAAVVVP